MTTSWHSMDQLYCLTAAEYELMTTLDESESIRLVYRPQNDI